MTATVFVSDRDLDKSHSGFFPKTAAVDNCPARSARSRNACSVQSRPSFPRLPGMARPVAQQTRPFVWRQVHPRRVPRSLRTTLRLQCHLPPRLPDWPWQQTRSTATSKCPVVMRKDGDRRSSDRLRFIQLNYSHPKYSAMQIASQSASLSNSSSVVYASSLLLRSVALSSTPLSELNMNQS